MVLPSQTLDTAKVVWQIDPGSTYVTFSIRHMGVSTVRGRFPDVRGTIMVD
jgi:polyisoprenoid-binding protein YceI